MIDRRYAMNVAVSKLAFWREPEDTWKKIGSVVPGVEMMFGGPPDDDVSKQIQELEMLISQDINGLVVFSNDSKASAPIIDKAVEKGIPVVTAFADIESKRLAHVGSNQERLAKEMALKIMNDFRQKINVKKTKALIAIGGASSQDQMARLTGIQNTIAGHIDCVGYVEDRFNAEEAERQIQKEFEKHNDIEFIFGCNSQSAIGAVKALKHQLQRNPGEVIVTAWDTETAVMKEIQAEEGNQGWIHATAVLHSSFMVQVCFGILEAENFGYLYPDTLNTRELKLPAVPKVIEIPMKEVVTSKNVAEYLGKL